MGVGGQAVLGSWVRMAILLGVTAPCVLLLERLGPTDPAPSPTTAPRACRRWGDVSFLVGQALYLPAVEIGVAVGVARLAKPGVLASVTRHGPAVAWAAVVFVAADLTAYWIHRCLHRRPLWRVHRLHHARRALDWLSGFRFHPLDAVIEQTVPIVPFVALGFPPVTIAPYLVAVGVVVAYAHADISFPESGLAGLVVTPTYHRIHHAGGSCGTNFALVLPVMDRIFRTTATPQRKISIPTANDSPLAT